MSGIGLFERVDAQVIASYVGTNRSEVAQGHVAGMKVIRRVSEGVIAAGNFRGVADVGTGNLALWNGTNWSRMGRGAFLGLDNEARCMTLQGSNVIVGGEFQYAGDIRASYIALWNGRRWSSLGNGLPEPVFALANHSNEVVALCSRSLQWSSQWTTNIWHWDGSNWRDTSQGNVEGFFTAVTDSPSGFLVAQQIAMTNFAISRWNGSSWQTLVRGEIDQPILKLLADGNDIIVAGQFTKIAGLSAGKIARWANNTWSTFGGGVSGEKPWEPNDFPFSEIRDVVIDRTNIYVGGSFTNAGGIPASNVARWDGSQWHALGDGLPGFEHCIFQSCDFPVTSLALANEKLFVGGGFTTAYSEVEGFLAVWDGTRWTNVVNSGWQRDFPYGFYNFDGIHVRSLVALGNQLFFGGNFSSVGPVQSFNFGILHDEDAPELSATQEARNVTLSWPAIFSTATLQKSDSLNDGTWIDLDTSQATVTDGKIELEVSSGSARSFYRIRIFQ
jgi:trimeric autotransporter adhesin